mgnify:FL=1
MNNLALLLTVLVAAPVLADNNQADLNASGAHYTGNLMINQASGTQQQQVNSRAIAIGNQAQSTAGVTQQLTGQADPAMNARASIGGDSFSQGSGLLGVNQSAGANNQMVNAVRVAVGAGPQSIDDNALSQQNVALQPNSGAGSLNTGSRQVVTSDQAFTGSRGVVQVNQSAGVGNRMANTLNVRVTQ